MSKPRLLTGALIASALLTTGCATVPDGPLPDDQMVFQVCLRDQPMKSTRQLDFTIVRTDRRDIEPTMPVGRSVADQPIFEAVAGDYANIKATLLTLDRKVWYGFDVPEAGSPQAPQLGIWSDWQPVGFVSRTEDVAYKLQHDLAVEKQTGDVRNAVKVRFTMMHYKDVLASRAMRKLELPHTDFVPC